MIAAILGFIPALDRRLNIETRSGTAANVVPKPARKPTTCFKVEEQDDHFRVAVDSDDGCTHLLVEGHVGTDLPATSIFSSVAEASRFFEKGSVGYSVTRKPGEFDGLELRSFGWQVQPLVVEKVESSFFQDEAVFPPGSVDFDSALLMRQIDHEWHGKGTLVVKAEECCHAG